MIYRDENGQGAGYNGQSQLKKASTAIKLNDLVTLDANGELILATATSDKIRGLAKEAITLTDTDYTVSRLMVVDIPRQSDQFAIDVVGGTLTNVNMAGGVYYDIADARTLNIAAAGTKKHCKVVSIKSPTVAIVEFNPVVIS